LQRNKEMISYLRHHEINRASWDACISRSLNRRVYAFSWYLDVVAPGWEALVSGDYASVFPLTAGHKAGLHYLFQPFFTQQLGLFSSTPIDHVTADEFIRAIPARFRYIDIQTTSEFGLTIPGIVLSHRCNHELKLEGTYEGISSGYSQNTRRNIRKAMESGVNTGRSLRAEELVNLFRENFGEREGKLGPVHYERLEKLIGICQKRGIGSMRAAFNEEGLLCAGVFFLTDGNRVYYLFAASGPEARENGAMFQLIDQFIREHAGRTLILDFEGGNDANLGRFYKSFGASEVLYNHILWNRLPFILNAGFRLSKAIRKQVK